MSDIEMEENFWLKKIIKEDNYNEIMKVFKSNNLERIQKLIDYGVDINLNDSEPFRWNIKFGKVETIELLMNNKTKTNDLDDLLNYICLYRDLNIVELLVKLGANIFAPTNDKVLVKNAVNNNKAEIVEFLCKNGIKIKKNTISYLREAVSQKNKEMIRVLAKNGVSLSFGKTPILVYILKQETNYPKLEMIQCLIENGLNIKTIITTISNYNDYLKDGLIIQNWCEDYQEKEKLSNKLNKTLDKAIIIRKRSKI